MHRFHLIPALTLCVLAAPAMAAQGQVKAPTGLWLTQNERSVVELYQCQKGQPLLCGKIAWIIKDGMQFDTKNPDASKHKTPLCGMTILSGLKMDTPSYWAGGKVYKADEGDTYDANMTIQSDNSLEVRGYVGMSMFGKSQTWKRVEAKDYPPCKAPAAK